MRKAIDTASTSGKRIHPEEHVQLLVVGAGPAGTAAAIEAAALGLSVLLVDEHPVDPALMGLDVPFHFGQRMDGSVGVPARLVERMLETNPALGSAYECGVDVRLGCAVWGLFNPAPGQRWLDRQLAGLADATRSWFVSYDAVVLATGRRDMGVAFAGWDLPGVMGVVAAETLLRKYQAFSGKSIVVLGTGAEAASFASAAVDAGLDVVAAVCPPSPAPQDAGSLALMEQVGIPVLQGMTNVRADGNAQGVTGVTLTLTSVADAGEHEVHLACDTVVVAAGAVPVVELFDAVGATLEFSQGAYAPIVGPDQQTTVPTVFAAGDCVSPDAARGLNSEIAEREGRRAARGAAKLLGVPVAPDPAKDAETPLSVADGDIAAARLAWAALSMRSCAPSTPICQCEGVCLPDLLGVRPPDYLKQAANADLRPLSNLKVNGAVNQDQLKRLTRAGMGACQGRRCREQISSIVALSTGSSLCDIPNPTYRAPVRPLTLSMMAAMPEDAAIAQHWDGWFAIKTQWVPYWEISEQTTGEAS